MRMPIIALGLFCALGTIPAVAQTYEGNWECLKGPTPAGILTIYTPSYGFASQTFGDPLSGTGTVNGYADGVQFTDGNLNKVGGVEAGRLVDIGGQTVMQLESQTEILMVCSPRQAHTGGMFGVPAAPPPAELSVTPPTPAGPRPN